MKQLITALLLFLIFTCSVLSQRPRASRNTTNRNIPFDKSVTKLPAGFLGIDGGLLFRELAKRKSQKAKGEFETTAEFNERIDKLDKLPILPGVTKESSLAFVLPAIALKTQYDANQRNMRITLPLEGPCSRFLLEDKTAISKYDGQNIFGAQREVIKLSGSTISLGWGLNQNLRPHASYPQGYFQTNLTFDPPAAARIKPKLRALIIGRLKDRLTDHCRDTTNPTYAIPIEKALLHNLIALVVDEIWIVDPAAGTIYARITQTEGPNQAQ